MKRDYTTESKKIPINEINILKGKTLTVSSKNGERKLKIKKITYSEFREMYKIVFYNGDIERIDIGVMKTLLKEKEVNFDFEKWSIND